jgi:hypothetical protein
MVMLHLTRGVTFKKKIDIEAIFVSLVPFENVTH